MTYNGWILAYMLLTLVALLSVEDPSRSLRSPKAKNFGYRLFMFSLLALMLTMGGATINARQAPNGKALTGLVSDATYTTEWFNVDGQVMIMRLKADRAERARYYEIPEDKIVFWGAEDKSVPSRFRVLDCYEGKFYVIKVD